MTLKRPSSSSRSPSPVPASKPSAKAARTGAGSPAPAGASAAKKKAAAAPAKRAVKTAPKPVAKSASKAAPKAGSVKAPHKAGVKKPLAKAAVRASVKPAVKVASKPASKPAPKAATPKKNAPKQGLKPDATKSPKETEKAPVPAKVEFEDVDIDEAAEGADAPAVYEPDLGRQQSHVNRQAPSTREQERLAGGGGDTGRDEHGQYFRDQRPPSSTSSPTRDNRQDGRSQDGRGQGGPRGPRDNRGYQGQNQNQNQHQNQGRGRDQGRSGPDPRRDQPRPQGWDQRRDRNDQQRHSGGPPNGQRHPSPQQPGHPNQSRPNSGHQNGPRPDNRQDPRQDQRHAQNRGQSGGPQSGPHTGPNGGAPSRGPDRAPESPRTQAELDAPVNAAIDAQSADEPVVLPPPSPLREKGENVTYSKEIFQTDTTFADLGLREDILRGVTEAGFVHPTTIQASLIPIILTGKDVLGQAKTGTGKTAAFGLPMMSKLERGTPFQGLVLVPTRELAIQACSDLTRLGVHSGLRVLPVYGGQSINTQAERLARGPEIIVATPGRMMDMVQRGYVHYRNTKMVVLDEVDRMLDIGFRDDIRRILGSCPRERQTVFVSATISGEIESLARSFAKDAEKIIATSGALTVSMVKQMYLSVEPWDKKQLLLHLLTHEEPALTLVFCRTKRTVDNLTEYLQRKGVDVHAIHGDMMQGKRNQVIEKLRSGKLSVLVASDLASRGIDVEGVTHVINYDLPEDPDIYVHRIGRTARAGRNGIAWALVTPEQGPLLTEIELLINAEIPKLDYPDFKPGPVPADVLASREQGVRRVENAKVFNRYTAGPVASPSGSAAGASGAEGEPGRSTPPAPVDTSRFPGGIVPSKLPDKRLMGRMKTARSMKAAISQSRMQQAKPAEPAPPPAPGT